MSSVLAAGARGTRAWNGGQGVSLHHLATWGKVYTKVIPDANAPALLPIIREKVDLIYSLFIDYFRSYNAWDVSFQALSNES